MCYISITEYYSNVYIHLRISHNIFKHEDIKSWHIFTANVIFKKNKGKSEYHHVRGKHSSMEQHLSSTHQTPGSIPNTAQKAGVWEGGREGRGEKEFQKSHSSTINGEGRPCHSIWWEPSLRVGKRGRGLNLLAPHDIIPLCLTVWGPWCRLSLPLPTNATW